VTLRTFSNGGGHQSMAALVLSAQGVIDFPVHLHADVGADSENPATVTYVRDVAIPYAKANGIDFKVLQRVPKRGWSKGVQETLYGRLARPGSRSLPIPIRMDNGAPGTRSCTSDFKIKVIGRWLREHGATAESPAVVGIGISLDEIQRANTRIKEPYERVVYPLVGIGEETGLKLNRLDCDRIIRGAGLPIPPKSACYFCPFHTPAVWEDMRRDEPELFEKAASLEDLLNQRRDMLGKDHVWLTRFAMPLREATREGQQLLPMADDKDSDCDSGWCFT
jgi:hypothetical protein